MNTEALIKERLGEPEGIAELGKLVGQGGRLHRKALAKALCERFDFRDEVGSAQTSHCLRALRALEEEGRIVLAPKNERLWEEVAPPREVPSRVDEILELRLELVENEVDRSVWNELMIREHPLGMGWSVGRSVRYLVVSEHGILGAVGFGPSALELADREKWIGWNREQKREHLKRIVGMNRFLIRPSVKCSNLASQTLSLAVSRIRVDFEKIHGYRPWVLESFVDLSRYEGTCYQAANWVCIGQTCGRGRQDRFKRAEKTRKAIYLYELDPHFRARMGLEPDAGEVAVALRTEADIEDWAQKEFGGAQLGDKRLVSRLVKIAADKSARPGLSCAKTVQGKWADTMGYYRFVEHPDGEALNMQGILQPHRERTIRRMKSSKTVLCIQDSTDLNYSANLTCEGLGPIGTNQTGSESLGLRLHSTLAVDAAGLPLGILHAKCYAPALLPEAKHKDRRYIPAEEKETFRWIEGQRDIAAVASQLPGVRLVSIADREGDFYEHFHSQQHRSGPLLLVRAKHNRAADEHMKIFESVEQTPVRGETWIHIAARSIRPKKGRRAARSARSRRDAHVRIRYMPVDLRPPAHGLSSKKPTLSVSLIHVQEPNPPSMAEDPVNWYLLTTMPINSFEEAMEALRFYCLRWRIEDWHRVLKSGCRVEDVRLKSAERLKRAIAIDMVVAWRIMLMTLLARQVPDLPAEVFFTELEIETLRCYAKKKGFSRPIPSAIPSP